MNLSKIFYNVVGKAIIHLIFWVIVYYFYNFFLGYGSSNTAYINRFSLFLMPITIAISYFYLYFLVPNYLLKQKHWQFVLYSIYSFIISVFLIILSILYGLVFLVNLNPENTTPITKTIPLIIVGVYFVVLVVNAIGLGMNNYQAYLKNEVLKRNFLEAQLQLKEQELKYLKLQIHPHFLFNSLNTIYGFTLKKSDKASEMILKLSSLLDYTLYQAEKKSIPLHQEITHLNDYILLEKMRFDEGLEVNYTEKIQDKNIEIAPMLLLPFVENAFKHGVIFNNKLTIEISLYATNETLNFEISNVIDNTNKISKGIGLHNIKKRLSILYPKNYKLTVNQSNNQFSVYLKINFKGLII